MNHVNKAENSNLAKGFIFRWASPLQALFFMMAALVLYRPVFDVFFCMDDIFFLRQANHLAPWPETIWRLLSTRGFFTASWKLFGPDPHYYHLIILLLHGLCGWLVVQVGRRLGLSPATAMVAGLFQLGSPVAFTSLHWISGGQEVIFAFFSLLTVWIFLAGGKWPLVSLGLFVLTLLSKEAGVFLLPALCLVMPMPRKRKIVIAGVALLIGAAILMAIESARIIDPSNPYETGFGLNVLNNLLKHLAWLVRFWDFHPDKAVTNPPLIWPFGLIIPFVLMGLAWWRTSWRQAIFQASVLFLVLLAPVLPLLRHSYHYYMLVPLIPLWLLAAAGLDHLPRKLRHLMWVAPLLLIVLTTWQGHQRRSSMMNEHLHADRVIRYAHLVESAVENLSAAKGPLKDHTLIIPGVRAEQSLSLSPGQQVQKNQTRVHFLMLERALRSVDNLRLFFPDIKSISLVHDFDEVPEQEWLVSEIYFNSGLVDFTYLGRGVSGCYGYAGRMFQGRQYGRARKEIERLLRVHPGYPQFVSELGLIGIKTGNQALVDSVLADLNSRVQSGPYEELAKQELDLLKLKLGK